MNTDYYYGTEGGEVQGPLNIESIRAAVKASRLPSGVMLSRKPGGPWAAIGVVERIGNEAFWIKDDPAAEEKPPVQAAVSAQPAPAGVSGWISSMGWLHILLGGLALLIAVVMLISGESRGLIVVGVSAASLFWGVLLLAISEVLVRLTEIRDALR